MHRETTRGNPVTPAPDLAVLHPDGRLEFDHRTAGETTYRAVKRHITDVGTQGMGPLRAYFTDYFADLPRNHLADRVLQFAGYHHPTGWRGTVVLTMEEDPATGECPPLTTPVRETLDGLANG